VPDATRPNEQYAHRGSRAVLGSQQYLVGDPALGRMVQRYALQSALVPIPLAMHRQAL
jgi:hypothetical protein